MEIQQKHLIFPPLQINKKNTCKNPNPVKAPCHRIVMSNGKMGSYISGIAKKKELLEKEGMLFENDATIYDFIK